MALKRNRTAWRDHLSRVTWQDFERVLADYYRDLGFDVEHCGTGAGGQRYDGGVDLVLRRDQETVLVQCKHWNAAQVPHNDVHQLIGLVETRGATRAVLVTSGEFTTAARDAASRTSRIELMDGSDLRRAIDPRLIPTPRPALAAVGTAADSIEWQPVVEKSVDALVNVMSGRAPWRRRRSFREELISGAIKLVFMLIVFLVSFAFIRTQLDKLQTSLAPASRSERLATPRTAPPPPHPASARPPVTAASQRPNGMQRMTDEELAEWERRNRESMEILERTTPELQR